jgi:hypothetical protein
MLEVVDVKSADSNKAVTVASILNGVIDEKCECGKTDYIDARTE